MGLCGGDVVNRESNNPYPKERRRLYRIGCKWAKAPGVCELTGVPVDPAEAHIHHILHAGSHPALYLCPWNWLVLAGEVHGLFHAQDTSRKASERAIEARLPGLMDRLRGMEREWSKKPLYEVEELLGGLPPREVFVREEMGRI